jgi:CrcB protein
MPWGTLAANLVGGYLVGLVIGTLQQLPQVDPMWRLLLVTGFLGALTTFSSFSAEVVEMLLHGRLWQSLGTTAAHLAGSLVLTWLGLQTATVLISSRA